MKKSKERLPKGSFTKDDLFLLKGELRQREELRKRITIKRLDTATLRQLIQDLTCLKNE